MKQLVAKRTVAERLKCHPEHLMRLVRQGRFPAPIKLTDSPNSGVRWAEDDVSAWIEQRMAARQREPV